MKIYNKKNFRYGLWMTVLGVLMLLTSIWKGFDIKGTVILAICLFPGIGLLLRSLSRDMSREDKIAELDERNKLVEWRAKSRALHCGAGLFCVRPHQYRRDAGDGGVFRRHAGGVRADVHHYAARRAFHTAVLQQKAVILSDFTQARRPDCPGGVFVL